MGGVLGRSISFWRSDSTNCVWDPRRGSYHFIKGPYDIPTYNLESFQLRAYPYGQHFIAYEQETDRNPSGNNQSVSSNLDDKTIHEVYLWPFMDGVHAGTGSIMCSYNQVNNSYACQNSKTLNGLLKGELDFQGFVVSDWGAQHSGVASANAGLDLTMPDEGFWGPTLAVMVQNGSVSEERVTDMATRYTIQEFFYVL